jgi:hypothetical protein
MRARHAPFLGTASLGCAYKLRYHKLPTGQPDGLPLERHASEPDVDPKPCQLCPSKRCKIVFLKSACTGAPPPLEPFEWQRESDEHGAWWVCRDDAPLAGGCPTDMPDNGDPCALPEGTVCERDQCTTRARAVCEDRRWQIYYSRIPGPP